MINRELFIENARTWLDTPWKHNQCLKGVGVDCVRFLACVAKDNNIDLAPMPKHYRRNVIDNSIIDYLTRHFKKIDLEEAQIGDILVFTYSGVPHHVALLTKNSDDIYIIHASNEKKIVVEEKLSTDLKNKIIAVFELKEVVWLK